MSKLNSHSRFALIISVCLMAAAAAVPVFRTKAVGRKIESNSLVALAAKTNGKLAFSTTRDGNSEIYTMNPDGSGQTRLTFNAALDSDPAWSPDGTRLLFVSTRDGNEEIYVMNADGSSQTRLTANIALDRQPVWSPDGAQIAFASNRSAEGNFNIFVMNADGSNQVNISNGGASADFQEPDWSPDGTHIACSQAAVQGATHGPYGVLLMNTNGSNQTRLTAANNVDINPRWSPDGTRLTFSSNRAGNFGSLEVFVMNADGSLQARLTNNVGENSRPFWSPDGTKIAFQSNKGLSFDIYVMNTDGSNQSAVALNSTDEFQPVWQGVSIAATNPIDDPQLFVRRHYLDFLNREPDAGGLQYWTSQITMCGADAGCVTRKRAEVSAAFFVEQEFQQTGYFIYRHYAASLCRRPTFAEFTADRSTLTVGPNLEATKQALTQAFVQRAEFTQAYPLFQIAPEFVDALLGNVRNCSGVNLDAERASLISEYNGSASQTAARARVLRLVIENPAYVQAEYNKAFVQAAYFGYLRRNEDPGGFAFWLDVLNTRVPNNYRAMVCAFITSAEYQRRFGTIVTRSNSDCAQ
jgi:Tol biopolymer transport system component